MTTLQVVVPVFSKQLYLLENCLESIKKHTPVDHVVNVITGGINSEERMGEAISISRSVYERFGLVITPSDQDHYNDLVAEAIRNSSDFPYTLVLPASHRISDREWFGKMQLPLIRAPTCGMTVAPDDMEPNTSPSFVLGRTGKFTSPVFMTTRTATGVASEMRFDPDGEDYANEFSNALTRIGSKTWIIPSCRIIKVW